MRTRRWGVESTPGVDFTKFVRCSPNAIRHNKLQILRAKKPGAIVDEIEVDITKNCTAIMYMCFSTHHQKNVIRHINKSVSGYSKNSV